MMSGMREVQRILHSEGTGEPENWVVQRLSYTASWGRRYPMGAVGACIVAVVIVTALIGPSLVPYDPVAIVALPLEAPSAAHVAGGDKFGRDVITRTVVGARVSIEVSAGASLVATVLALSLGSMGGFFGRWIDGGIQRFVDVAMAFPGLILLIAVITVVGPGVVNVIVVLGVLSGVRFSRVIRSAVLSIKGSPFVEAVRAVGASELRVMARHVLPNTFGPTMVIASTVWGTSILAEAALSFLGLGVPPPAPSWGNMISGGRADMEVAPWIVLAPGIALALTVFGFNMLGDAMRDALDPKMRRRG